MGLGKTIMTISLLLSHSERGGSSGSQSTSQLSSENGEASNILGHSPTFVKKSAKVSSLDKLLKHKPKLISGGNLIICPMTLLGQWKVLHIYFNWKISITMFLGTNLVHWAYSALHNCQNQKKIKGIHILHIDI